MKLSPSARPQRGSTLATVLVLCSVTLVILGSVLNWTTTTTTLSHRNNEYFRTVAAAEAATEKVISSIVADYKIGGDTLVRARLGTYAGIVPTTTDDARFGEYQFSDGQGGNGKTYVQIPGATEFRVLNSQYRGLRGYSTPFRILSNARDDTTLFKITGAVLQDVEATAIPLFQFAIFYNIKLEINPGPVMDLTGPVHGNDNIYLQPQNTLTFHDNITSAGTIINDKMPGDPLTRSGGTIVFGAAHDSGVSSLNLPIGTNNSGAAVHQVIEPPPAGESSTSPLGSQRLYNKADMIITIPAGPSGPGNSAITVTSGISNNKGTTVPQAQWDISLNAANGFIRQVSFTNPREGKTIKAVEIDVEKFRLWSSQSTNVLRPQLPLGDVTVVYVDDKRPATTTSEPGVRLVNGARLPSKGLTVVTPNPIYVKGDYNTTDATGTSTGSDTAHTKPAALIGDAITILSSAWTDASPLPSLGSRSANNTTVNAAFLAGIVETTSGNYSGGVENFPRFLEDWSGKSLTYNGSMVVMFPSQIARGNWGGTGDAYGIYNPPDRRWAFDTNFRDVLKLPPGTPMVRKLVRGTWKMVKPNSIVIASP